MRSFFAAAAAVLASTITSVSAIQLNINNWSSDPAYMWVDGQGAPVTIKPNGVTTYQLLNGPDHNLKMSNTLANNPMYTNNIMQFEYSIDSKFTWDLSLINGNPFGHGNVKVSPTGPGSNDPAFPNCRQVKCPANSLVPCAGVYLPTSAYNAAGLSRPCPLDSGIIWLDLFEPSLPFSQKRSAFTA